MVSSRVLPDRKDKEVSADRVLAGMEAPEGREVPADMEGTEALADTVDMEALEGTDDMVCTVDTEASAGTEVQADKENQGSTEERTKASRIREYIRAIAMEGKNHCCQGYYCCWYCYYCYYCCC